jgi:YfiH family protein
MSIKILRPTIFADDRIVSGVTFKNQHIFPETGLTFTPSPICSKEQVDLHKKLLADKIGVKTDKLKFQHQIHSDIILVKDETSQETDSDAMITDKHGLILCVKIADCAAILVYDPMNQAIAAIHSGWRGTQQNITAKAIKKMSDVYGSNPEHLLIYISPAASGKNYEVGEEVAEFFPESTEPRENGKYLFDNTKELLFQLQELNVHSRNIEVSGICTIENINFHSYRRDRERSGRMCAFIGMNSKSKHQLIAN